MRSKILSIANTISSIILVVALLISFVGIFGTTATAWSGTAASSFESGSGTESNPYVIKTPAQMGYFLNNLESGVTYEGVYIKLGANLDLTAYTWSAIGEFNGTLDGGCYTITTNNQLLAKIGTSGVVKRLNVVAVQVEDSTILCNNNYGLIQACTVRGTIPYTEATSSKAGMICKINFGTVQYCGAVGKVRADGDDSNAHAGMVAVNQGTVDSCFAAVSSSASASGKYNYDYDNPVTNRDSSGVAHTVSNCYYNNTLYTYTVTDSTGVSTEFMQSEDFLNLIASFTVPETKWVTGSDGYPTLEACGKGTVTFTNWENMKKAAYHDANLKVSMTRGGVTSGTIYYTTDGTDPRSSSTRKSTTAATAAVTLSGDMVLSAVVKSGELYGTVTRTEFAYLPGDGDNVDPYLILTKKGLDAVRLEPSAYYQLATDLTFTEADYELGAVAHNGWTPIPEFTGTFDGAGHAITGLKGTKGGLISTNKGMITSLRMLDHKLYSANSTGPIANTNYTDGVITRCYARSAFTLDDLPSVSKVEAKSGGIVGSNNGVVSYCKTEGVVPAMQVQNVAGDHAIGGIVGTGGTVNNCVSTALLVSKSSSTVKYIHIGGIAGERAKASNCLALHSIYEYSSLDYQGYLGGIVGGYYPDAASANYCVTGGYDFVSAKNEDRFYCSTYVYSGYVNSCYKIESGNRPSDFADLDFTNNWMFTDEGLMVQGVMDADGHCYSLVDSEDATCTKEGTAYVKCDLCGATKFCAVPALGHDWNEPTYNFAEDGMSCTASRICKNNETHIEATEAEITSAVKIPATCEDEGTTTYTATFAVEWAIAQTKDVKDIEVKKHGGLDLLQIPGTDPTCGSDGWLSYSYCEDCGKYFDHFNGYCEIFDLEAWKADAGKTPATGEHTYENGVCVDCGTEISVSEIEIIVDIVGTNNGAQITAPTDGWKEGTNTFYVTCEKACVVVVSYNNGETYERLPATKDGDQYAFTAENMTVDTVVKILVKADANGDGYFSSVDVANLLTNVANSGKVFSELQNCLFDDISAKGAADLLTAIANNMSLEW